MSPSGTPRSRRSRILCAIASASSAFYLSEGLGHAFIALEDDSTVMYMCSAEYAPGREHGVSPVCPEIALEFPKTGRDGSPLELLLSEKDTAAPNLAEAREAGLLPT